MHNVTAKDMDELRSDLIIDSEFFDENFGDTRSSSWHAFLRDAELFWISEPFRMLAKTAADCIPSVTLDPEIITSPHGILVWEGEVEGMSGFCWKIVGGRVVMNVLVHRQAAASRMEKALNKPGLAQRMLKNSPIRSPLWSEIEVPLPLGTEFRPEQIGMRTTLGYSEDAHMGQLIAPLALSLWLLLGQTLAQEERVYPTRAGMKRVARMDVAALTGARYVTLRRSSFEAGDGEGAGRHFSHQWVVRGHWRNQPYGPGLSKNRPIWIRPQIRGPEGAPMLDPSKLVNVLKR